ncbi:MAG: glycoside hydrolase family 88 protein [Deltaproteobacteria bacterium]|nr:glycoside hydrolase family 88 protein [Deltaproteobacteria bacterium]
MTTILMTMMTTTRESDDDTAADGDIALALARDLADTWLTTFAPHQNAWSWDAGILMIGLLDLAETTGDPRYEDYVRDWLDHHIDAGYNISSSDTSVPGYSALRLYEKYGHAKYLTVADDVWHYIRDVAGRTSDGGLNHLGWISGNQIWIDTLFMIGPFLMRYAERTGDDAPYEEYALQLDVFRTHLRSPEFAFYRHRYDDDTGEVAPEDDLFWGRGNGWVFAAQSLALGEMPESVTSSLSFDLRADLDEMEAAFDESRAGAPRLTTILNVPETYRETSVGLLVAYGKLLRSREDGEPRMDDVEDLLQGAIDQIVVDEAGDTLLLGTSYGTSPAICLTTRKC